MRGAATLRLAGPVDAKSSGAPGKRACHLLDWTSVSIKTVTRSTYVSELAAALAATDGLLALSVTMHEIAVGPKGPKAAMDVRDGLVMCLQVQPRHRCDGSAVIGGSSETQSASREVTLPAPALVKGPPDQAYPRLSLLD